LATSYLLDTNTVSLALRDPSRLVLNRIAKTPRARVAISVITAMEMRFGLAKKRLGAPPSHFAGGNPEARLSGRAVRRAIARLTRAGHLAC